MFIKEAIFIAQCLIVISKWILKVQPSPNINFLLHFQRDLENIELKLIKASDK